MCDGLDNDCDGTADEEALDVGEACRTGQGGSCDAGTFACLAEGLVCQSTTASDEVCDGLDNDCDGTIDNGLPGVGDACATGQLGVCGVGAQACQLDGTLVCAPSFTASDETCDGLDNDCDGVVDDACCSQVVADGSFEEGTPNASWSEASTNWDTPLCDMTCGTGNGTGPRTGDWWAWFGGADTYELGVLSQEITLPMGTATLRFWLEISSCDGVGTDTLEVSMDGTVVFATDNTDPVCNLPGHVEHVIDMSAFADGGTHVLEIRGEVHGAGGGYTDFFVDDVSLTVCS